MVAISATSRFESANVRVTLTGLTAGTRYDVYRLRQSWDADADVYERILPDKRVRWSSVAHRIAWEAPGTSHSFTDYEPPLRPFVYFVVLTSQQGPFEYDFANGTYPLSRGDVGADVIHQQREIDEVLLPDDVPFTGNMRLRSTQDPGLFVDTCLYDFDEVKYVARGTEFPVIGRQYPMYVADTRETRRGTFTIQTKDPLEYEEVRNMVFPGSGKIEPFWMQAMGDEGLDLLDDMLAIPLDVTVENASRRNLDWRFITVDYVEVDPTSAYPIRTGDNDSLVTPPDANFTISDRTLRKRQTAVFTSTSTGQIDRWEWSIQRKKSGHVGKRFREGPHTLSWRNPGKYWVKLRVWGPGGVDTKTRTVRVR